MRCVFCTLYAVHSVQCAVYNVPTLSTFILYTHFIYTQVYRIIYVCNAMYRLNIYTYTGYTMCEVYAL